MSKYFSVALLAAKKSGELVLKKFDKDKIISKKQGIEIVTDTDVASEKLIKKIINDEFPDHNFIAEESVAETINSDYIWHIDPIDGTANFAQCIPHFCISIALEYKKEVVLGIVFDPVKNEIFSAQKGKGAFLNNKKINVSKTKLLKNSILATGFAYDRQINSDDNVKQFCAFIKKISGIRRMGSAALDLCYVACGRFDGYWERNIKSWDVAAGVLILQEAGGMATDYEKKKIDLRKVDKIISSNSMTHKEMYKVIKESYKNL